MAVQFGFAPSDTSSKGMKGGLPDAHNFEKTSSADPEMVMLKIHKKDIQQVINKLLKVGEDFENKPGASAHVSGSVKANFLIRRAGNYYLVDLFEKYPKDFFAEIQSIEADRELEDLVAEKSEYILSQLRRKLESVAPEYRTAYAKSLVLTSSVNEEILNHYAEEKGQYRVEEEPMSFVGKVKVGSTMTFVGKNLAEEDAMPKPIMRYDENPPNPEAEDGTTETGEDVAMPAAHLTGA